MPLKINAAVQTHMGLVRTNNEDNFYLCGTTLNSQNETAHHCTVADRRFLAAVADGMGGEACGEVASLIAVNSLRPCCFTQTQETALDCIRDANAQICAEIEMNGGRRMGSTLAALYIDDGKAICCNIGDSRVYLMRDGILTQLSLDHNKARRMVALGVLTPEQAARHPCRHELTQHLGIFKDEMIIEPYFSEAVDLQAGDKFLLCSDGLTDMVTDAEIVEHLRQDSSPQKQAETLIQIALTNGGRDNVTALVVQVDMKHRSFLQKLAEDFL